MPSLPQIAGPTSKTFRAASGLPPRRRGRLTPARNTARLEERASYTTHMPSHPAGRTSLPNRMPCQRQHPAHTRRGRHHRTRRVLTTVPKPLVVAGTPRGCLTRVGTILPNSTCYLGPQARPRRRPSDVPHPRRNLRATGYPHLRPLPTPIRQSHRALH